MLSGKIEFYKPFISTEQLIKRFYQEVKKHDGYNIVCTDDSITFETRVRFTTTEPLNGISQANISIHRANSKSVVHYRVSYLKAKWASFLYSIPFLLIFVFMIAFFSDSIWSAFKNTSVMILMFYLLFIIIHLCYVLVDKYIFERFINKILM